MWYMDNNIAMSIDLQVQQCSGNQWNLDTSTRASYCTIGSDIHILIFQHLNLRDLATLRKTHSAIRQEVQRHVTRMIAVMFYSMGFDGSNFLTTLGDGKGIVFGSVVLSLLNGGRIKPQSLDVIVPMNCADQFINKIIDSYSMQMNTHNPSPALLSLPNVRNVAVLSGTRTPLNVIITRSKEVLTPLFSSHSSAAMNYLTQKEIYCAYPDLTLNYRNVLNSTAVQSLGWNATGFGSALAKYETWGYTSYATLANWTEFDDHICGVERNCPRTRRWLRDGDGFRFLLCLGPNTVLKSNSETTRFLDWQLDSING